jgi:hypothetical protein
MDEDNAKRSQTGIQLDSADGDQAPSAGEPAIKVPLSIAHSAGANISKLVLKGQPGVAKRIILV